MEESVNGYNLADNTYELKRNGYCVRCGHRLDYSENEHRYCCTECETIKAKERAVKKQNEHYKKTGRWSKHRSKLKSNLRKAREMGLSYGQYMARMMNNGDS